MAVPSLVLQIQARAGHRGALREAMEPCTEGVSALNGL